MKDCPDEAVARASPAETAEPAARDGRRPLVRVLVLATVLVGAMVAVYCSPIRAWVKDANLVRQVVASLGVWGYPACVLAVAVLVGCGIPRLALCTLGGMLFGFWTGFIVVQAGTIFGYYAVFLFVRWGGRDWVTYHFPALQKWLKLIREQGVAGVMLARQLPIHGTLVNLCLGLSHAKHRHFLIGTAIGVIPEAVPFTLVGAGLVKGSFADAARYLVVAAVALGLVWIACAYAMRLRNRNGMAAVCAEDGE